MRRLRIRAPKGRLHRYRNTDLVKDGVSAMLMATGAPEALVVGRDAAHWMCGPVFSNKASDGTRSFSQIVMSTPDERLSAFFPRCKPSDLRKVEPATGEELDMSGSTVLDDPDPVVDGMTAFLDLEFLTPFCVSRRGDRSGGKWADDAETVDLSAAVNHRLSRLAGRPVRLVLAPDDEYLATRHRHSVRVSVKERRQGQEVQPSVVVGLRFPFILSGSAEDLRFAWYAGLGEKNRLGFGAVCLTR